MSRLPYSVPPPIASRGGRTLVIHEPLARGERSAVYRGVIESAWGLRKPVAVKVLEVGPEEDGEAVMGRLAEVARRVSAVRHPSVIETLEVDRTSSSQPLVVMELVEGETLMSVLSGWRKAGRRVPLDFALVVTLRIADALGAMLFTEDADGTPSTMIHGDLSPRQVLVSNRGEVKVGDFGLSSVREPTSQVRARDRIAYTAPEVAFGEPADATADVFALGMILREMLVGPRFAPGTSPAEAVRMVAGARLHLPLFEPNLPPELKELMYRALAPRREDRYPHARAMAFDLRRLALRLGLSDEQTSIRHAIVG